MGSYKHHMTHVCIFRQTIYGYSGTELPPPGVESRSYAYLSEPDESLADFKARMQVIGMEQRKKADEAPVRAYSQRDGWDWSFSEIKNLPD